MIKVSVIIPVFNTDKYLNKCLDSVVNQSEKDIEIIVINDGSTDDSEKIIKSYKDKRIKYIKQKNKGIGKSRNLGIEKSQGEFIAFLDSDDYLDKDFCKKMYAKAKKNHLDIVMCDFWKDEGELVSISFENFKDTSLKNNPSLLFKINLGSCNKIFKRELFENSKNRFIEDLKYEDVPFVVRLFNESEKIGKINEALTYYVIHENSETTIRDERIFDIIKIVDITVNYLKENNYEQEIISNFATMVLLDYNIQQRYVKSFKYSHRFIKEVFKYLNKLDKSWRKCTYLKDHTFITKIVKSSKILTNVYCDIYRLKLYF